MSDAPERIWAGEDMMFAKKWREDDQRGGQEYIRADLADAKDQRIKELEEALRYIAGIDNWNEFGAPSNRDIARAALNKGATK